MLNTAFTKDGANKTQFSLKSTMQIQLLTCFKAELIAINVAVQVAMKIKKEKEKQTADISRETECNLLIKLIKVTCYREQTLWTRLGFNIYQVLKIKFRM